MDYPLSDKTCIMKKELFSIVIFLSFQITAQENQSQKTLIYFDKGSSQLTAQGTQHLDALILSITDPSEELRIIGHTDSDSDVKYNEKLSFNRTQSVKNYLISHNINNRLHIDWKGELKPINSNTNESEKTLNRRVEIIRNYKENVSSTDRFKKEIQTFLINPNRDTVITGNEGTQIFIRAGSFNLKNNSAPVEIKLAEFYKKSDLILNNLSTSTIENEALISAGTIEIEAFSEDQKIDLKKEASIQVLFTNKKADDGMEAYYAREGQTVTKWTTEPKDRTLEPEPVIISKSFKIRNLDTMEIKTEMLLGVNGLNYKVLKTEYRGHPSKPFSEKTEMDLLDSRQLASSIFFSPERALTVRTFGRINCDKNFDPQSIKTLEIIADSDIVPTMVLILDSITTVIPFTRREENKFIFENVPANTSFDIIAFYINDGEILFGQAENVILKREDKNDITEIPLQLKSMSEKDFRLAVQNVNDTRNN